MTDFYFIEANKFDEQKALPDNPAGEFLLKALNETD
jgi:hypothetical protein